MFNNNCSFFKEERRKEEEDKEKEQRIRQHRSSSIQPPIFTGQGKSALDLKVPSKIDAVHYPDPDDDNFRSPPAHTMSIKTQVLSH